MKELPDGDHHHSPPVKSFNRDHDPVAFDLSEAGLIAEARRQTGLDRFGDESFLPALRALLVSLEREAQLNAFGCMNARVRVVRSLSNRLWANACFEAHPEIREMEIAAPIVIVGPHRSGTTRLQRMLAADPRLQYLNTWEGMNPAPRLERPELGREERRQETVAMLAAGRELYPGAFTAHPMEADWPEEEMLLLNHSFQSFSLLGLFPTMGYYHWFLEADRNAAYRDLADFLRLIAWSRGGATNRRWVLKNPQHMLDLDLLLKVFPDARLVFTHRDPLKTVGSVLSLMWFYAVQNTDAPCRDRVRDVWLDFCEQLARRMIELRERIPAAQQLDVYYADINRDWRSVMARIYEFSDLDFDNEAERALAEWLAQSERENRHGGHRYLLEDFGVTRDEVDQRMMFLRQRYVIPYEGK